MIGPHHCLSFVRGSQIVVISMLDLLMQLSVPNRCTDYFCHFILQCFSVYWFNSTGFDDHSFPYDQTVLISMYLQTIVFSYFSILILVGEHLYFLAQLGRKRSHAKVMTDIVCVSVLFIIIFSRQGFGCVCLTLPLNQQEIVDVIFNVKIQAMSGWPWRSPKQLLLWILPVCKFIIGD